jgi:general secretion pathway protein K
MTSRHRPAFALSVVLWVVAALMLGTALLMLFAKDGVRLSAALEAKLRTQIAVEEVYELLEFYATTASYRYHTFNNPNMPSVGYRFPVELVADGRAYELGSGCTLRVMDTSGLVNVMMASPETMAAAAAPRSERQLRYELEDSLADWLDRDDVPRLNGAESTTYRIKERRAYDARNARGVQDVGELRLVRGFDRLDTAQWERLRERTYFGRPGKVNLMLVDADALGELLQISESYAATLAAMREEDAGAFMAAVQKERRYDEDRYGFSMSRQLRIEIVAETGEARSVLHAVAAFAPDSKQAVTVYSMRID